MSRRPPKPTPPQPRQRARYGSSTGSPNAEGSAGKGVSGKVIAIFAVAMVLLVVVMAGQAFIRAQSRPVTAEFITQERIDDSTARLWIEVDRKDTTVDAYCVVFAVDYEHAEVGRREVFIPAGGEKLQSVAVDLPTRAPVSSGRIYGCSQDVPFYMDTANSYLGAR